MTWDQRIKATATLLSLVAIIVGGWQFLQNQRIAAARPYLEKKLDWCEDAVKTVSALAVSDTPRREDKTKFWQLYWGTMVLIENDSIEKAMIAFGNELEAATRIESNSKGDGVPMTGLRGASLNVARACRAELAQEWSPYWLRRPVATEGADLHDPAFPSPE